MAASTNDSINDRKFEEFSIQNFLRSIIGGIGYLLSKWFFLLLGGLALGLLYIALNFSKKPVYTAEMSFALDDGAAKSTTSNTITSLSAELGFGPTYEAGGVFSSATNILELMQSRLIINKTLKRSVLLNNKPIVFINFFLDSLDFRKKWMAGSPYEKVDFTKSKFSKEEERFTNGIINNVYALLTSSFIKVDKKGKGSSLIQVTLTSENEAFSKYFLEALVDEVSKYYIEIKTFRAKLHLEFIQKRTDSTSGSYRGNLYSKAALSDANINPVREVAVAPIEKKQTDVQVTKEAYVNLVKSLEAAKTSLMEETPLFQYLDVPVFPLKITQDNLTIKFILFFIIGIIITSIFLLIKRLYRSITKQDNDAIAEEISYDYPEII